MTVVPINGQNGPEPSATGTTEKAPDSGPTRASAPARARETTSATPDGPAVQGAETPSATPETSNAAVQQRSNAVADDRVSGLVELFRPPELWSEPRPSLSQMWAYAAWGPWTDQSQTTPARIAGCTYGAFAVGVTAIAYAALWFIERPARVGVLAGIGLLASLSWFI